MALTLLRKPERDKDSSKSIKTPTSPGGHSMTSTKSGGSDRITHPIPADVSFINVIETIMCATN